MNSNALNSANYHDPHLKNPFIPHLSLSTSNRTQYFYELYWVVVLMGFHRPRVTILSDYGVRMLRDLYCITGIEI